MTERDLNTPWARALVEELYRAGVREACVAPGSRSTPLVLALHRHGGFRIRVFLDERSAGFFALGVGKGSGIPAAVVTTSGTAVANLMPAAVEAHQSEAPLILLTADRPHHLRDADANQAIRQPGIFRDCVREGWDLPQPRLDDASMRHLRAVAVRAVAAAVGDPPGPVHVNVPLRKPLEPRDGGDGDGDGDDGGSALGRLGREDRPLVRVTPHRGAPDPAALERVEQLLDQASRPILVAGPLPRPHEAGAAIIRLAAARGLPLLADPLSGARTQADHGAVRVSAYDLFLRSGAVQEAMEPDLVLRVGAAPTSAALNGWLGSLTHIPQVVVDAGARWKDHLNAATDYLRSDPTATLLALARSADRPAPARWRDRWAAVDSAALQAALDAPGPLHEGHVAAMVMGAIPSDRTLFVSSSMPVRDVDGFGGTRADGLQVFGNRGASGIDGIVATAAGVASGTGRRVVALLGDLAFLHDANGLLALREDDVRVTLVVVNNDGGGIFHMLPVRDFEPPFTQLFATPHGLDLSQLARLHGLPHRRVEDLEALDGVLGEELESPDSRVVEIITDRDSNRVGHEAAMAAALAAARDALNNFTE